MQKAMKTELSQWTACRNSLPCNKDVQCLHHRGYIDEHKGCIFNIFQNQDALKMKI